MSEPRDMSGAVVALVTPFDSHDRVDEDALAKHVTWLESQEGSTILVNGTTGEFFSLTPEERARVFMVTRSVFGRALLFQAGADSLALTLEQAELAGEHGADAVVVIMPYYYANAPRQGIVDYCNTVASHSSLPLILYNFPKHTNNPLSAEMLADIDHYGMKDSSADLSLVQATPHYWIGGDPKILAMHKAGGIGFVSAHSNHLPHLHCAMERALSHQDLVSAEEFQTRITEVSMGMRGPDSISAVKHGVARNVKGYPTRVRLPLADAGPEKLAELERLRSMNPNS